MKKEVIYIDVEDDITAIIDKTLATTQPLAVLVLPKRPAVLLSSVNVKLLKKSAQQAKKRFVLITGDQTVHNLAGAAGLYVAKNLQSKPFVPIGTKPAARQPIETTIESSEPVTAGEDMASTEAKRPNLPRPAAAQLPVPAQTTKSQTDLVDEEVELDNTSPASAEDEAATAPKRIKKNPKLVIPSFEKFRLWFFLAIVAVVVLLVGGVVAALRLPKANVQITTKTKDELVSFEFTAATDVTAIDTDQKKIPVQIKEAKKTYSEKVVASGQLDKGTPAGGTITLTNCSKEDKLSDTSRTVPEGTGISMNGLVYVTTADATIEPSGFTGNTCKFDKSKDVAVVAKEAGDKYNAGPLEGYSVSGFGTITGNGTAMTGGTSKIVKILSEDDVNAVRQKISSVNTDDQKAALESQLKTDGFVAVADTYSSTQGEVVISAKAGDEVAEATATLGYTFTMAGIKQDAIEALLTAQAMEKLDKEKEEVYNTGIDKARLKVTKPGKPGEYLLAVSSTVVSGPKIDQAQIKKDIAGKKRAEAESMIGSWPGVQTVTIEYGPFWVTKAPSKPERISITIESANDK